VGAVHGGHDVFGAVKAAGCPGSGSWSIQPGATSSRMAAASPAGMLLRLLIADLVGEEVTRESITTIRDDISDLFTRVGEAEVRAAALPSRTKYLLLVHGFLRRLLDLHLEFVDDLERELAPDESAALE
jgi:hypothetical protein